jgi:hypothetical protein
VPAYFALTCPSISVKIDQAILFTLSLIYISSSCLANCQAYNLILIMKQLNIFQITDKSSIKPVGLAPARIIFLLLSIIFLNNYKTIAQCSCIEGTPIVVGSDVNIPTLTVAMANFPGFNHLNGQCVRIRGVFAVDGGQTWLVENSYLLFDANSEVRINANSVWDVVSTVGRMGQLAYIRVQSDGELNCDKSAFINCQASVKWGGILLRDSSNLNMDSCTINLAVNGVSVEKDADFAIQNSGFYFCSNGLKITGNQIPAQHLIRDNLFYDCNIGINISSVHINIDRNTYRRNNISTMTGIYCATGSDDITITGGNFFLQTYGVDALLSSRISLSGAHFTDCLNGVNFFNGSLLLDIIDNEFTNTTRHAIRVYSHNTADIEISENRIFTGSNSVMSSILVGSIRGGPCDILQNNPVQIPGAAGANGIEVTGILQSTTLNVNSNVVNQTGAAAVGGILVNNAAGNATVNNNTVLGIANMLHHIRASGTSAGLTIQGNQLGLSGGLHANRGLELVNNSGVVNVCCNQLSNSRSGLFIEGTLNSGSFIGRNTFNSHPDAGLHYNMVTSTGAPQFLTGNDWRNYSGACPARFDGSIAAAHATQYTVSLDLFPQGYAGVCTAFDPQEWFLIIADLTETTCAMGGLCTPNGFDDGSGERSWSDQEEVLSVVPNPADQSFSVAIPESVSPFQVNLSDLSGRILLREDYATTNGVVTIHTGSLPAGVYFLQCKWQNRDPITQKVVIRH